jgi:3-oxoacyl-[acyl-carrier protein] reductase
MVLASSCEAEALAKRIEQAGGRAITAQADVSDPVAVARLFDAAEAAYGGVDVLVNNAASCIWLPLPRATTGCSTAISRST